MSIAILIKIVFSIEFPKKIKMLNNFFHTVTWMDC